MSMTETPLVAPAGGAEPAVLRPRGSAYAELSRQIKRAGLLDRRPGYYAGKVATTLGMCGVGVVTFLLVGNSWWQLAVAAYFAVVSTQLGFVGHDAGHRQIFKSGRANYVAGVVLANLGVGFSYGWWVDKHNRHHAHPNDEAKDPDVAAGALVFTTGQARPAGGPHGCSTGSRPGASSRCCCWKRSTCGSPASGTSSPTAPGPAPARRC